MRWLRIFDVDGSAADWRSWRATPKAAISAATTVGMWNDT